MEQYHETILVVEDDVQIRNFICYALKAEGFRCVTAGNAATAMKQLLAEPVDMMLLDLGLPDMDGGEALKKVREWSEMPIIIVSARDQDREKAAMLDLGADDYLTKPFNLEEFNARVQSLIRRYLYLNDPEKRTVIEYKGLLINLSEKRVVINGSEVALPNKEFELLVYCAQNPKKILSKKRIFEAVWKQEYMYDDNTIMATMSRLRKKIDGLSAPDEYIQTIKGMGYRFNAPV